MMIWKRTFFILVISLVVFVITAPCLAEAEKAVSGEVSLSVLSSYIWRGQELSRHSMVLQPSFTLSYKGFSANLWGNWDSNPYFEREDSWNETDYTFSYKGEHGLLNYGAGTTYYDNMNNTDDSQDVFLSLGLNTLFHPTVTVYKEVGHDLYWYFMLAASTSFPLLERLSLDLSASAGYLVGNDAEEYPEVDGDGNKTGGKFNNFHDGTLMVGLPYTVSQNVTLTPNLSYTFPLCDEARWEMKYFSMSGKDSAYLYGGVIFSYRF